MTRTTGTTRTTAPATTTTGASTTTSGPPHPPTVPAPFGRLVCAPTYGIRLCRGGQSGGKDRRVPSFDGVPLDADVALPATGTGPFPLIVLLHGLGESKAEFESTSDDGGLDDVTLAHRGWAVLMYTARGFGDSCGTPASRAGTPACAKGWIQLADQRYEIRDTQYLAGVLVDEGLARPDVAVAGVSYGAGQTLELATLKNRMRLMSGKLVAFTSPNKHVPMSVAAGFAVWPWDDLVTSLVPNGNLSTTRATPPAKDREPVGVAKKSWVELLYGVNAQNYLAPPGADPQANLTVWEHQLMAGEPYGATAMQALKILQDDKSAIGIPLPKGGPAPVAIQSGWTDTLFPVSEALHFANRVTEAGDHEPMLMMFDDQGHGWAQNKPADVALTTKDGIAFLDAVALDDTAPQTGVVVIPQTCPASAPSGPPRTGANLGDLQTGMLKLSGSASQQVTSSGGSPATASALDPAYDGKPLCRALPAARQPGTAVYRKPVGSKPLTLLGGTRITAHLHIVGNYPELVGRLWDVAPGGSTRQIVALGVVRPAGNQGATATPSSIADTSATFELDPNEYTFAPGHTVELELVGSNAPLFRKSNGKFTVTLSQVRAVLPTG